jgi:hypothetical protein
MTPDANRVGLMILRIWTEGSSPTLRARITHTLDLSKGEPTITQAAGQEQVLAIAREWIEAFAAEAV